MKKAIFKVKKILKAKIEWQFPPKIKMIIYGDFNSTFILNYVDPIETYVLRTDTINVYVFLISLLKFDFSTYGYFCNYIRISKPDVIITSMDNDVNFWALKVHFPTIKLILLQYAMHTELGDIFGELKKSTPKSLYKVDHLFLFNVNVRDKYLEYISGETHITGSFKNNSINVTDYSTPGGDSISFISQYRPEQIFHPVFFYDGKTPYYRDTYYETETKLLPLVWRYCKEKKIRFQICGHGNTQEECNFFGKLIGNYDWDFIPRLNSLDSYKTVLRSSVVIGVDSALAFEAFGIGKRVGFFSCRYISLKNDSFRIGWPNSFQSSGPFWTSNIDVFEIRRILDFLLQVDDLVWNAIYEKYSLQLMSYDKGNTQLLKVLKQLNVKLKNSIS